MPVKSDKELITASKKGDKQAFMELTKKYANQIYNLCWRFCGNEPDAQDLSQEVFFKTFKSIITFSEKSSFYTWLYRIATNSCINEAKKRGKIKTVPLDLQQLSDTSLGPDKILEKKQTTELLQQAIGLLLPEHRLVLILRYVENKSYQEIAEICQCESGTVASRINRAVQELRKYFKVGQGKKS